MNYTVSRNQMQQRNVSQIANSQNVARFGAHELLDTHEVLSESISCINQFEMFRPLVKDPQLAQILDNQINFWIQDYNNLVNYLHNSGGSRAIPYRSPKRSPLRYGLQNPIPDAPNTDINQISDQDIAFSMLSCAKSSAQKSTTAALEAVDPVLREIHSNSVISCINMAYETFQYMNQRGYYQVPTLQQNTTQTVIDAYQPLGQLAQVSRY